jgi:hypothetical protein
MEKKILSPKVEAVGFLDIALLGLSKSGTEQLLTPIVGNGTYMSGALKLLGGGLIQGRGKVPQIIGGGLVIDGVDDIVGAFLGGAGMKQGPQQAWWL